MREGKKGLRNAAILATVLIVTIVVTRQNREDMAGENAEVTDVETGEQETVTEPDSTKQCGDYCYETRLDDTVEITAYMGDETVIYIPSYIEDKKVTTICPGAFKDNGTVQRIYIPQGVEEIMEEAFAGCSALQDIYISESVKRIGERAIADCSLIEEIVFPKELSRIENKVCQGDTALKQIMVQQNVSEIADDAFTGCEALRLVYGESKFAEEYAQMNGLVYVDFSRIREEGNLVW